jgi:hypothetical protein
MLSLVPTHIDQNYTQALQSLDLSNLTYQQLPLRLLGNRQAILIQKKTKQRLQNESQQNFLSVDNTKEIIKKSLDCYTQGLMLSLW